MTTIACNRKSMAADERVTTGSSFRHEDKIFRYGSSLYGTAGHGSLVLVLLEWLRTPRNRLTLYKHIPEDYRDDVEIIELRPGGIYLWDGWGVEMRLNESCWAVGSGGPVAIEAMENGLSPKEAVHRAMKRDEATGPPVREEYLRQRKRNGSS